MKQQQKKRGRRSALACATALFSAAAAATVLAPSVALAQDEQATGAECPPALCAPLTGRAHNRRRKTRKSS